MFPTYRDYRRAARDQGLPRGEHTAPADAAAIARDLAEIRKMYVDHGWVPEAATPAVPEVKAQRVPTPLLLRVPRVGTSWQWIKSPHRIVTITRIDRALAFSDARGRYYRGYFITTSDRSTRCLRAFLEYFQPSTQNQ